MTKATKPPKDHTNGTAPVRPPDSRHNRSNRKPALDDPRRRRDRPQLADFDTWVEFQEALAVWEAK